MHEGNTVEGNIARALWKSRGLRAQDFPQAQAMFHRISPFLSQYRYSNKRILVSGFAFLAQLRLEIAQQKNVVLILLDITAAMGLSTKIYYKVIAKTPQKNQRGTL